MCEFQGGEGTCDRCFTHFCLVLFRTPVPSLRPRWLNSPKHDNALLFTGTTRQFVRRVPSRMQYTPGQYKSSGYYVLRCMYGWHLPYQIKTPKTKTNTPRIWSPLPPSHMFNLYELPNCTCASFRQLEESSILTLGMENLSDSDSKIKFKMPFLFFHFRFVMSLVLLRVPVPSLRRCCVDAGVNVSASCSNCTA